MPKSNCPSPEGSKVCHFWGDPHFSHLFTSDQGNSHQKGGRFHHTRLSDYNPTGVVRLAQSESGDFEAQAFFCPAYGATTTGVALAIKTGDDVVQMVRGEVTKGTGDDGNLHFTDLRSARPEHHTTVDYADFVEFYVNGERKQWSELGTTSEVFGANVPNIGGGLEVSDHTFIQQMHSNHEGHMSMLPTCTGDGKNLVEMSTAHFDSNTGKRVFEQGVTIRMQDPGSKGVCSDTADQLPHSDHKVDASDVLFSSVQMQSLCDMCGLKSKDGVCNGPAHKVTPQEVCSSVGASYKQAKKSCEEVFSKKQKDWLSACIMETCVTGVAAVEISEVEKQLEDQYETQIPQTNCPAPEDAKVCHLWGDPHFTHVFSQPTFFGLTPGSVVGLKGNLQCADDSDKMRCNRPHLLSWEQFTVENAGSGRVALRGGQNGKYCADEDWRIICNRDAIGSWEKFQVLDAGEGKIALRGGKSGKVCVDNGEDGIACNVDHVNSKAIFELADVRAAVATGHVRGGHGTIVDYQPKGNFLLAKSADNHFEVQSFMCPAYGTTTTSVAVAVKVGSDTFQMMRSEHTAPSPSAALNQPGYYTFFEGAKEGLIDYYVNGNKMEWNDLEGGVGIGSEGFLQQMQSAYANPLLPTCAGDHDNIVEMTVPYLQDTATANRVFHTAVTVRMASPANEGLCSRTDIPNHGEQYRVSAKRSLFSRKQMKMLCEMCRLDTDKGVCGGPSTAHSAEQVCTEMKADINAAKETCRADFEEGDGWFESCVMEVCANGEVAEHLTVEELHREQGW